MVESTEISVILPIYNGQDFIGWRCREIVASLRKNDLHNYQFVFVNDGSADGTARALAGLSNIFAPGDNYKAININANAGTFEAERVGLRGADGKYVFFQDIDDPYNPALIEELLQFRRDGNESVHIAAPTKPVSEGCICHNVWHTEIKPMQCLLVDQLMTGKGLITRRSVFSREVLLEAYAEIAQSLRKAGIRRINAVQDSVVITYLISKGIFTSVTESKEYYLYNYLSPESMSHDSGNRKKDLPILTAVTAYAIDKLHPSGVCRSLAEYLMIKQKGM